jgi:hypothetical protein
MMGGALWRNCITDSKSGNRNSLAYTVLWHEQIIFKIMFGINGTSVYYDITCLLLLFSINDVIGI